jgi:hypothetical protein
MKTITVFISVVAAVAYSPFPQIDTSVDACLPCTVKLDRGSLISMISEQEMCDNSDFYGSEVTEPFLSRLFFVSGVFIDSINKNLKKRWEKSWQLRTVSIMRKDKSVHHIIFPFVIDTGGYSTLLGLAATSVLRSLNATESHGEEVGLCSLSVALPIQSEACVVEYHREGTPSDLRDNMIGEANARAIVSMDGLVTAVLEGPMTRDEALHYFMKTFGSHGAIRDDAEREFDMTLKAPIVPVFPPKAAVLAILKRARGATTLAPSPATTTASSATKVADEL